MVQQRKIVKVVNFTESSQVGMIKAVSKTGYLSIYEPDEAIKRTDVAGNYAEKESSIYSRNERMVELFSRKTGIFLVQVDLPQHVRVQVDKQTFKVNGQVLGSPRKHRFTILINEPFLIGNFARFLRKIVCFKSRSIVIKQRRQRVSFRQDY